MEQRQVLEASNQRLISFDMESKLLQSRMLFIDRDIDAESVATYQAELLYLSSTIKDKDKQHIEIYINSPGGEVYSALGMYDMMQLLIKKGFIIETKVIGLAASAASVFLMAGSPGYRFATENSTIMIHQPSSGTYGTVTDNEISLNETVRLKKLLNGIINKHCHQDLSPLMERDKWLTPEEAKSLGIIDKIL